MNELHPMETRRRSRSKTPFLRSHCDHEHCDQTDEEGHHQHHHKKKASGDTATTVPTINEESIEVTSSSPSPNAKKAQQKIKTSDYSSEDTSPDNSKIGSRSALETHRQESAATYSTVKTTITSSSRTLITKSTKGVSSMNLGAATSTPKANNAVDSFVAQFASSPGDTINATSPAFAATRAQRGVIEATQNETNTEVERSLKSEKDHQQYYADASNKSKNGKSHRIPTTVNKSNNSSNNSHRSFSSIFSNSFGRSGGRNNSGNEADQSDHIAYQEYKRAGEYWKTTPKTDYTYSELSQYRRELAPGVIAMPNMSRHSLENHHERVHYMIEREPAKESYIRRRYYSPKNAQNYRETSKLMYDSGDEVDYGYKYNIRNQSQASWFVRILTTVVTTFSSICHSLFTGMRDDRSLYRRKVTNNERGLFGKITDGISSAFFGFFRCLSLFISYVLSVDTWLLQSSNRENKGRKRFLLALLILLPLLLLAGLYYYLHPAEPFPPKSFSQHLQTLTLPQIDLTDLINQAKYDAFKEAAYDRFIDFRDWTDEYLLYLKTVSQNIAAEGRKLFRGEEYYQRV